MKNITIETIERTSRQISERDSRSRGWGEED